MLLGDVCEHVEDILPRHPHIDKAASAGTSTSAVASDVVSVHSQTISTPAHAAVYFLIRRRASASSSATIRRIRSDTVRNHGQIEAGGESARRPSAEAARSSP